MAVARVTEISATVEAEAPCEPGWMAPFLASLARDDLAPATPRGYCYDLRHFLAWHRTVQDRAFALERLAEYELIAYRQHMVAAGRRPATARPLPALDRAAPASARAHADGARAPSCARRAPSARTRPWRSGGRAAHPLAPPPPARAPAPALSRSPSPARALTSALSRGRPNESRSKSSSLMNEARSGDVILDHYWFHFLRDFGNDRVLDGLAGTRKPMVPARGSASSCRSPRRSLADRAWRNNH